MYIWRDTAPARIINLNNCVSIEADEENNELYAIGNDGERYFLHSFKPENEDPRQAVNAIRLISEYLEEGRRTIDMSDIEHQLRPASPMWRRPRKRLYVQMDDGIVIERETHAATFVEMIEKAGIERVHALGLKGLIKRKDTDGSPESSDYTSDSSGLYSIRTVDAAERKKRILERIGEQLSLQWDVEVIKR